MKQEEETFTADAPWMHLTPSLGPCSSNVQSRNIWGSALSLQRFTGPNQSFGTELAALSRPLKPIMHGHLALAFQIN